MFVLLPNINPLKAEVSYEINTFIRATSLAKNLNFKNEPVNVACFIRSSVTQIIQKIVPRLISLKLGLKFKRFVRPQVHAR